MKKLWIIWAVVVMVLLGVGGAKAQIANSFIFPVQSDEVVDIHNNTLNPCSVAGGWYVYNDFGGNWNSTFGCCSPGGANYPYHPGMDYNRYDGNENSGNDVSVYSIADGTVIRVVDLGANGWAILVRYDLPNIENLSPYIIPGTVSTGTINNASSVVAMYLHLYDNAFGLSSDDHRPPNPSIPVTKGQLLGHISSSLAHLHFEIRAGSSDQTAAANGHQNAGYYDIQQAITNFGNIDPEAFIEDHVVQAGVGCFSEADCNSQISQEFQAKYNLLAGQGHNLGNPWSNGPYGVFVHEQDGMYLQDFYGASNNYVHPYTALVRKSGTNQPVCLVKEGFWSYWTSDANWVSFGAPVTDEYQVNNVPKQTFNKNGQQFVFSWENGAVDVENMSGVSIQMNNATFVQTAVSSVTAHDSLGFPVMTQANEHFQPEQRSESGSGAGALVLNAQHIVSAPVREPVGDDSSERTVDGVYNSGVMVIDFNQSLSLVNQQNYSGFYAMISDAAIPIENFTMDGDMTIYIDGPPPSADLQFDFWTIYPNPATVGQELHVEGEIWNAGGVAVTATEVRVELLDPNGAEVYHYSEYGVTVDPGWSWYQWLYCYPYMPGNHTARFRCQVAGQWQTLAITTIYVQPVAPTISFSRTPIAGNVPLMVQFTDQSGNYPTAWSWNFGDGQVSTARHPSHNYNSVGVFNVSLTASNAAGSNSMTWNSCVTVSPAAPAPVASFGRYPNFGTAPLTVSFSDQSSNAPTSWNWNFGDGQTSNVQNPTHSYNSAGSFNVSLTATNAAGSNTMTWNSCVNVIAAAPTPVANFTANITSGEPPLAIQFTDLSTGNPTAWNWNFGDGETSNVQNPNHSYNSAGVYNVMLSVANASGSDDLLRQSYVTVAMPPAFFQLSITRLLNGGIALDWETVPGASAYNVYAQRNGGEWELLFETTSSACSMGGSGFAPGNVWIFYVTAVM